MNERRKSKRRPILETFSIFAVVPRKGIHRLKVHDLSESGTAFDVDVEGEDLDVFPLKIGDEIELRLYLNQVLYLPLSVEVIRVDERHGIRKVGAEFTEKTSKSHKALQSFMQMLDAVLDVAQIDAQTAV